ncbi:High-affinity glucose transporter RGT2 [Fusarium oxysporum f. sp. albedinis]|nr:High-affinity glucose transporter RGT2 [Fusarium oxysporum f. sp. albedinis]
MWRWRELNILLRHEAFVRRFLIVAEAQKALPYFLMAGWVLYPHLTNRRPYELGDRLSGGAELSQECQMSALAHLQV